jgi:TolB-like protein/DNA-binding winged helix-turn-helix (wHTH) protein/Tfp pilus assembly protein PilF
LQNGFHVGDSHQVEPSLNSVTGPVGTIRLEPKVMQVLVLLAAHAGQVVAKERLIQTVWPDAFVTDDVLTRAISELRRVFGDDAKESRFIQTIPKSGYRLIAGVSSSGEDQEIAAPRQPVHLERRRTWKLALLAISLAVVIVAGAVVLNRLRADTQVPRVTIAILPFEHLGGPEREYLTDGLTEETSASLGQIDPEHLSVKGGRTSTRTYKHTSKSLAEIGQELGAEYLLEGSVQSEGSQLRVTAKLIRASDQEQVWAESYDRDLGRMLELQRDISVAIARQVQLRISPDRLTALARRHTHNAEAYDFYLRGRHLWNQLTPATNRLAVEQYQKATKLDPTFALPWAGLADIYSASPINSDAPTAVSKQAREAVARAMVSGPDLVETQTALGTVSYWFDWDWPAAERAYRKAIVLDPGYAQAHRVLGIVLASMGRHEEARTAMRRARERDPFYPMQHALSAHVEFLAHDYKAAQIFGEQAIAVGPTFWIGYFQLALVHERMGNNELALKMLNDAEALSGGNSKTISLRGYILAKLGRTNEAESVLRALQSIAREKYVPPYAMALVHAGLDQRDLAFDWLDRAIDARDVHLVWLTQDAKWNPFREDPRFRGLVERCNFMRTAKTSGDTER